MDQPYICRTLSLFRAVARYYCTSWDQHAQDARTAVRTQSRGTDSFYTCLSQDLDDLHAYWSCADGVAATPDSRPFQDATELIEVLATTVTPQVAIIGAGNPVNDPETPSSAIAQSPLWHVLQRTRNWDLDNLNSINRKSLCEIVQFSSPSPQLRRILVTASDSAARSARRATELDVEEELLATSDEWALAAAIRVCEPLLRIHKSILEEWTCICDDAHSDLLASFALPCQEHNQGTTCLLNFISQGATSRPWRIMSVTVDESDAQAVLPSVEDLHDVLSGLDQQTCQLDGKLAFNHTRRTWTLLDSELRTPTTDRPVMVNLKDWIMTKQPSPISKVRFVDRVALATTLCYAFLELGGTSWVPYDKTELNVWLTMYDGDIPRFSRPFIGTSLEPFAEESKKDGALFWTRLANPHMPCLLALGKLILELIVGRAIPWDEVEDAMEELEDQHPDRLGCLQAIRSCIGFDDPTFKAGCIRGDERLRTEFLTRVVYKLNYILADGCRTSLEHIISQHTSAKKSRTGTRSPQRSISPRAKALTEQTAHCLHDHGQIEPVNQEAADRATDFLQQLEVVHNYIEDIGPTTEKVKVAILDTGTKFGRNAKTLYGARVKEYRTWLHPQENMPSKSIVDGRDDDGHGTHSTIAFLKSSSIMSDVYVAQVFAQRDNSLNMQASLGDHKDYIAKAIIHAVQVWKVDIISMSFGYEAEVDVIESALRIADTAGVLLLAAASNVGGNTMFARRWPAKRPNVICMYACEGGGNAYDNNPSPDPHGHNFTALGVSVPLLTIPDAAGNSAQIFRSGTSISTPIAAAIAACVLETMHRMQPQYIEFKLDQFARRAQVEGWTAEPQMIKKRRMIEEKVKKRYEAAVRHLKTANGMNQVFALMAEARKEYEYVQPWKLLHEHDVPITLVTKVFEALENANLLTRMR